MEPKWHELVQTDAERKVFEALSNPKWDYRTIAGLKKATGLSTEEIEAILQKYRNQFVHKAAVPDKFGRDLYTLSRAESDIRDMLFKLRTIMSKTLD